MAYSWSKGKTRDEPPASETAPFKAKNFSGDGKRHLLFACPGFMEATELPKLLHKLARHAPSLSIRIILAGKTDDQQQQQQRTQETDDCLLEVRGVDGLHYDEHDWNRRRSHRMPILLNELRQWADVFVVAPLGERVLANIIEGLYDDLVTSIIRTWDTEALMGFKATRMSPRRHRSEIQAKCARVVKDSYEVKALSSSALHAASRVETQFVRERKVVILVPEAADTVVWTSPVRTQWMRFLRAWHWIRILEPLYLRQLPLDGGPESLDNWHRVVWEIENTLYLPIS